MNTKQPNPSVWLEPKLMLAATPVHIYSFSLFLFPERWFWGCLGAGVIIASSNIFQQQIWEEAETTPSSTWIVNCLSDQNWRISKSFQQHSDMHYRNKEKRKQSISLLFPYSQILISNRSKSQGEPLRAVGAVVWAKWTQSCNEAVLSPAEWCLPGLQLPALVRAAPSPAGSELSRLELTGCRHSPLSSHHSPFKPQSQHLLKLSQTPEDRKSRDF